MPASSHPPSGSRSGEVFDPFLNPLPPTPVATALFLKLATRIAETLAQLHKSGIVHQNIRPANIRIHRERGDAFLLNPADSRGAFDPSQPGLDADTLSATLPYIAPEQTGSMNRPIDQRADLYSLGVTFYEQLAGSLPFHAEDPSGWVHCHIARLPRPLLEAAPSVPPALAAVIMKLLQKAPEERYQTARGVKLDLERCLSELGTKGEIEPFPLGQNDVWDKLRLPTKLYGRERELQELRAAFERVLATSTPEVALITGYSGIGKSALVQEMQEPILRKSGFFLSGKFDQYMRDIPYVTIGQAFRELVREILTESEAKLEEWRRRLLEALGPNGQLVIDVIPQIEHVIGKQPPVPPLPISDAQNRFNMVFRHLIGVFAKTEHPLVLFLDDLQWVDFASLKLLHHVIAHPETKHLFFIGAYRDQEAGSSHPFITTVEELQKSGARVTSLTLNPLSQEDVCRYIADALHCSAERAEPLARIIAAKTGGNPFFVTQFLAELYQDYLVTFDEAEATWRWNVEEIEAKNITDNIVDLMVSKLQRLSGEAQAALQLAACIGNEFGGKMLALVHDKEPHETYQDLDEAVRAEFMLRRGDTYKFLHDRVQQAAYMIIPEEQRSWVHLRIGRILLERTREEDLEEKVFNIVNQLNIGVQYVEDEGEKRRIAELNLLAGRRAKASAAYQSAASHLRAGLSMFTEESWSSDYELTYQIHIELAECECLNGNFAEAARLCSIVLARAKTKTHKASAYRIKIQLQTAMTENEKGIETGIECLKLFGIELSPRPDKEKVLAEFQRVRENLRSRRIEDLYALPRLADPDMVAAMDVLAEVCLTAFYADPSLYELMICHMVSISVQYGNTGSSTMGYATFGTTLCDRFGEYQEGYLFGKLAYDLTERHEFLAFRAQVCNLFGSMISIWTHHISKTIEYLRIGFQAALETGNITYGCFNNFQIVMAMLIRGDRLEEVYTASLTSYEFISNARLKFIADCVMGISRLAQNMRGLTATFSTFSGDDFDQGAFEDDLSKTGIPVIKFWYQTLKLQGRYMSGDHAEAMAAAAAAKEYLWAAAGIVPLPEYYYYAALTAAALYPNATDEERREHRALLTEHEQKLRVWAESCPDNYLGKHLLIVAEIARLEGRVAQAAELYDEAVVACQDSGFVQNEGLAYELAARFYEGHGASSRMLDYLRAARACYVHWEASGKVAQLDSRYPALVEPEPPLKPSIFPTAFESGAEQVDSSTAFRVAQALSSETSFGGVIAVLMRMALENTGARTSCLLLPSRDGVQIAATARAGADDIDVTLHEPPLPVTSAVLPGSLINYVKRAREQVILDDASRPSMFSSDEYIARERPKSVLCAPITQNDALLGILYLENSLVVGAFTKRGGEVVAVLTEQAAIALGGFT